MKLCPLISVALSLSPFTVNVLASSVVRARSLATVDEATKRELSNLLPRDPLPPDQSAIILCDGTNRSGNCYAYQAGVGSCNVSQVFFSFLQRRVRTSVCKYPSPSPTISKPISSRLLPIKGMFASCTPRPRAPEAVAKLASTMMAGMT